MDEISRLIGLGYTDTEIIDKTKLSEVMYYHYRKKLFREHGRRITETISEDSLAFHMKNLENRLNKIYRTLDVFIMRAVSDRADPMSAKEIAPVAVVMENVAINLFKLQHEGLRIVKGNGALTRYDRHLPERGGATGSLQVLPSSAATTAELSQRKF